MMGKRPTQSQKKFHKLSRYIAESESPQQEQPTQLNPEEEAKMTYRYRKSMENIKKGKLKNYENP